MSPRLEQLKPRQNTHNGPTHGEKSFRHKDLVGVGRNFPVVKPVCEVVPLSHPRSC